MAKELVKQEIQVSPTKNLIVTVSWCKACGICMEICPRDVLGAEEVTGKVIMLSAEKCNGCGLCELACPDYVFTVRELGELVPDGTGATE